MLEERKGNFDFGPDRCSKTGNKCRIGDFLKNRLDVLAEIAESLAKIPPGKERGAKSDELQAAEDFIQSYRNSPETVRSQDPCTRVGDLLLALESASIPNFYTMNGRESQHLCRIMKQTLYLRPRSADHPEIECQTNTQEWPKF
jgi:hypothetical protein